MKKKTLKNREGSALLVAIVIMMVVTMLGLALLLVSYSLFNTANKQQNMEQCKEMAQSISRELQEEIAGADVNFNTWDEAKAAIEAGESPLWFYLRCNLWQTSWPYYNDEERGHTASYAYRYFDISSTGTESTDILDGITVKIYWESESDAVKGEDTPVIVEVTCQRGKQKSTITSTYELAVEEEPADYGGEGEKRISNENNPDNNIINTSEKWTFSLTQRE